MRGAARRGCGRKRYHQDRAARGWFLRRGRAGSDPHATAHQPRRGWRCVTRRSLRHRVLVGDRLRRPGGASCPPPSQQGDPSADAVSFGPEPRSTSSAFLIAFQHNGTAIDHDPRQPARAQVSLIADRKAAARRVVPVPLSTSGRRWSTYRSISVGVSVRCNASSSVGASGFGAD